MATATQKKLPVRPRESKFNSGFLQSVENGTPAHATTPQGFGNSNGRGNIAKGNGSWLDGLGSKDLDNDSRPRSGVFSSNGHTAPTFRFFSLEDDLDTDSFSPTVGSRALADPFDSDYRGPKPSLRGETASVANQQGRSAGVSPVRKMSLPQGQPYHQLGDNSTPGPYSSARNAAYPPGPLSKPSKSTLDPASQIFSSSGFSWEFGFGQPGSTSQRPETSASNWSDANSVHSPGDGQLSSAPSDYFGRGSAAPSRNGSLPPSRHGDNAQYALNGDDYTAFAQASTRQPSSFSHPNGRLYQERSASMQSDSFQVLARQNREQEMDSATRSHRPSVSGPFYSPPNAAAEKELHLARNNYPDSSYIGYGSTGAYTPEGYSQLQNEHNSQLNPGRFDSRSAPNGSAVRRSPMYSSTQTPQFDHLYPSRTDHTLSNGLNFELFQSKLVGYQQQQQEERRPINHNGNQYLGHQFPLANANNLAANNMAHHYAYQVHVPSMPSSLQMATPQNYPLPIFPPGVLQWEPPTGPREQSQFVSVMSLQLQNFKKMYTKDPKKFELNDIYDHIVEFCGDQHGSRFIQGKLAQANSEEKARVFAEIQNNVDTLMSDVFGNYVIQKFFEHGTQSQKTYLANSMKGRVLRLSQNKYACRVVQTALEFCLMEERAALVKELEGHVMECIENENGNHVIQKAVLHVPQCYTQFIIDTFRGQVGRLAQHQYGCRIIQRFLEACDAKAKRFILDEIFAGAEKIIKHNYGNYVAQHVIEHSGQADKAQMIDMVKTKLIFYSKHKFASNVVEKSIACGSEDQRREMIQRITAMDESGTNNLVALIKDPFGNYVIQKILKILAKGSRPMYDDFVDILRPEVEDLQRSGTLKQLNAAAKLTELMDKYAAATGTPEGPSALPAQRTSISSAADSLTEVPPLVTDVQSPQSSAVPSPVHETPVASKADASETALNIAKAQ